MNFEKYYNDGPPREKIHQIEKYIIIERPDVPQFVTEVLAAPISVEPITPKKSKETNEKSPRKIAAKKPRKNNPRANKATVESIQTKL